MGVSMLVVESSIGIIQHLLPPSVQCVRGLVFAKARAKPKAEEKQNLGCANLVPWHRTLIPLY